MSEQSESVDKREYEERLRFETLLSELSARFINLAAEEVDAGIVDALRRFCECLGFDGAVLWQWDIDTLGVLTLTHHYRRVDGPPLTQRLQVSESFPWCLHEVQSGRSVLIPSLDDMPEVAGRDQASFRHFGAKDAFVFPLRAGGDPFGLISFHDMMAERPCPGDLIRRLELVSLIFANAIFRMRTDLALKASEERLALATEAAGAGLWIMDAQGAVFWAGNKLMEILGLPPAKSLDVARFMDLVHPADRQAVRDAMTTATQSREMTVVEYRLVRPDGQVRWLQSRGRLHGASETARLMGITSDITRRKDREIALRESEARMAAAMDVAELGFYELLNNVRVTFLDRRAREIIGASEADEKAGRILEFWMEHIDPDDRPGVMEVRRAMEEAGRDRMMVDYRFRHPERGVIHIHHLSHVMERDAAGRAVRTIGVLQDVTERKRNEAELRRALDEVRQLRDRLELENVYLREQMLSESGHSTIIGESEPIKKMLALARRVGPTKSTILITGETGTGKELLAQAIHDLSSCGKKIMVKVNCAALPAPLIESELFGREKGAYTGAMTRQVGRFELANGSTIFLDEIGELPLDLQAKLLRVLQDGQYERLGSNDTLKTDARLIAATNRDLITMVREGKFREDLFHRLNVFPIEVPPLRSRVADIPLLVWKFIQELNVKMGRSIGSVSKSVMERLNQYPWPGNVRELRNVIERAMILSEGRSLMIRLPETESATASLPLTLQDLERKHILGVLERTHWRIRGKGGAAEILGLVPTTLHSRLQKLGISRPAPNGL